MSVNEIKKIRLMVLFLTKQVSIPMMVIETINVGFGTRKLLNDNTLILGANTFSTTNSLQKIIKELVLE